PKTTCTRSPSKVSSGPCATCPSRSLPRKRRQASACLNARPAGGVACEASSCKSKARVLAAGDLLEPVDQSAGDGIALGVIEQLMAATGIHLDTQVLRATRAQ